MTRKFFEIAFTDEVRDAQLREFGRSIDRPEGLSDQALGTVEQAFIAERDSFYMATVNSEGWPYVQHRGGEVGFLKVLDEHRLAFADLSGNRQMVSTGNIAGDDRVALFLMDYPGRRRLKIMGRAHVGTAEPELLERLFGDEVPDRVERVFLIDVVAHDWNCPQYITPRYSATEVEAHVAGLKERISALESELEHVRSGAE